MHGNAASMSVSQQRESSTLFPLVASAGLFLVTTAVSQWARGGGGGAAAAAAVNKSTDDKDFAEEGTQDYEDLRRWYHSRRNQDRLSYENIAIATEPPTTTTPGLGVHYPYENLSPSGRPSLKNGDGERNNHQDLVDHEQQYSKVETEWNLHRQRKRRASGVASDGGVGTAGMGAGRPRDSRLEMHPNADYDFHPKNRNWRHFEHFNEDDRKRNLLANQETIKASSNSEDRKRNYQANAETIKASNVPRMSMDLGEEFEFEDVDPSSTNYDDDGDDDSAQSISSEGSGSSEEQFVWMKHHHRGGQHTEDSEDEESWPEALRRRLPSGLTNIFENSAAVQPTSNTTTIARAPSPSLPITETSHSKHKSQRPATVSTVFTSSEPTEPAYCGSGPPRSLPQPNTKSRANPFQLMQRMMWSASSENRMAAKDKKVQQERQPVLNDRCSMRAQYNARIMPKKLIMVRHGQSMGNINELLYSTMPDNAMPLTDLGWKQACATGKILKEKMLASGETVHFIVSPYVRTVETFHGIVSAWCDPKEFAHIQDKERRIKAWYGRLMEMGLTWSEDSRIREQDFGNYQVSTTRSFSRRRVLLEESTLLFCQTHVLTLGYSFRIRKPSNEPK
jgi:hypothetical protein